MLQVIKSRYRFQSFVYIFTKIATEFNRRILQRLPHTTSTILHGSRLISFLSLGCGLLSIGYASLSFSIEVTPPKYYGPLYRADYRYGDNTTFPTLSEVLSDWWTEYKLDWNVRPGGLRCNYTFTPYQNGLKTGEFGRFALTGQCTGGGRIFGTAQCSKGYAVSGLSCIPNGKPKIEKNLGLNGCSVGNPIFPNIGNKFILEIDYKGFASSPLQMFRAYNSQGVGLTGWGGNGWTHAYSTSIFALSNSSVLLQRAEGQRLFYILVNGVWITDSDIPWRLSQQKNAGGSTSGWQLTTENDQIETFDASGKLISISNRPGQTQSLTYTDGLLTKVTDQFGRYLSFSYNLLSQMVSLRDPAGYIFQYSYDDKGRLKTVAYPDDTPTDLSDNPKKIYVYGSDYDESIHTANTNQPFALTGIIDENGERYATYRYDATGKAISTEHNGGAEKFNLSYADNGNTAIVTDPLGTARTTHYKTVLGVVKPTDTNQPGGSGCGAAFSNANYDVNGNITSHTDFNGNLSCYAYDLKRNLETVRIEGLSSDSSCPSDLAAFLPAAGSNIRKISTQWRDSYRLPTQIDQAERRISFAYDTAGNLVEKSLIDLATQQSRSWRFSYNSLGQILTQDGPRTDVDDITTYAYYSDNTNYHSTGDLWKISNALGHTTTFNSYDANGRLLSLTDPNGLQLHFRYDPRGRLLQKTVDGNTTQYDYDLIGNLTRITSPEGVIYRFAYDAAHRLTDIQDALGGKIHYTLDAMGNRIQEDISDSSGALVKTHRRVYDALSRLAQDIGAYNQTTHYEYDANGNLKKIVDANGHTTEHAYDSLNRLIHSTDALKGLTEYQYTALDQLTSITDANLLSTAYSYNNLGDLTKIISPHTGTTDYSYDFTGNLIQKKDAGNITTTYTYDALDRLLTANYPGTEADAEYRYDTPDPTNPVNQKGRLTSAQRGIILTNHKFDLRGNLVSSVLSDTTTHKTINSTQYRFNADEQVSSIQTNPQQKVEYEYNESGQTQQIQFTDLTNGASATQILADNIQHLPFGVLKSLTYGNGLNLIRQFNLDYQITTDQVDNLQSYKYEFDAAGNVQTILDEVNPQNTFDLEYDSINRLKAVTQNAATTHYAYDSVGNRTEVSSDFSSTNYIYTPDSQHLENSVFEKDNITKYGYKPQGHIEQIGDRILNYAPDQRLISVKKYNTRLASYLYDTWGRRIRKTTGFKSTNFAYDQRHHLISEILGENAQQYVYLDDQPLARIDNKGSNKQFYYFHNNHLGTPSALSNQQGQIDWQAQLDPFGHVTPNIEKTAQSLRLPGQYFDTETGWHYNFNRYYDPESGRYLQADPIGLSGGNNLYAYAQNNPLYWVDPDGLNPIFRMFVAIGSAALELYDLQIAGIEGTPASNVCKGISTPLAPSIFAKNQQGSGLYPGIDRFKDITLQKGTIIFGGAPGQSSFYTTSNAIKRAENSASKLFQGLQVAPHPLNGYRPGMTAYEVIDDIPSAFGRTLANPQNGVGGLPQLVIPNWQSTLRPIYTQVLLP